MDGNVLLSIVFGISSFIHQKRIYMPYHQYDYYKN